MTISYFDLYEKDKDWDCDNYNIRYNNPNGTELEELYFKYSEIAFTEDPSGFCKKYARLLYTIFFDFYENKFSNEVIWDCIKRPSKDFDYVREQVQWACLRLRNCPKEVYEYVVKNKDEYSDEIHPYALDKLLAIYPGWSPLENS